MQANSRFISNILTAHTRDVVLRTQATTAAAAADTRQSEGMHPPREALDTNCFARKERRGMERRSLEEGDAR